MIENTLKWKDFRKSIVIHISILLSLSLSSISEYLDQKQKNKNTATLIIPNEIKAELISEADYLRTTTPSSNSQVASDTVVAPSENSQNDIVKSSSSSDNVLPALKRNNIITSPTAKDVPQNNNKNTKITIKRATKDSVSTTNAMLPQNVSLLPDTSSSVTAEPNEIKLDSATPPPADDESLTQLTAELNQYDATNINQRQSVQLSFKVDERVKISNVIEAQIEQCWSRYSAGQIYNNITITIFVTYDTNGYLTQITSNDKVDAYNEVQQKMYQDAIKAINDCNPLNITNIRNNYKEWKTTTLHFKYK